MDRNKSHNEFFTPYKERVEKELALAACQLGEKTALQGACEYALLNGGKRFRPFLVLLIAEAMPAKLDVMKSALAVEFFHTASLIADDLPCMDNDDLRRGKPALHKVYGESVAILASFTLISLGYSYIYKNAEGMAKAMGFSAHSDRACVLALQTVSDLAGIFGATSGQFLDLFPQEESLANLKKMIQEKTVSLFEICFVLGWLFGGGTWERLAEVKKCSHHLGMAFQIADDLQDLFQDKDKGSNIAAFLGSQEAISLCKKEMSSFEESLISLNLHNEGFQRIISLITEPLNQPAPALL